MTPHEPTQRQVASSDRAMQLHGFHRVFRTGGNVTAAHRKHRRDPPFVLPQQGQQYPLHPSASRGFGAFSEFLRITSNARSTSFDNVSNSASRTVRLGLNTTSNPLVAGNSG